MLMSLFGLHGDPLVKFAQQACILAASGNVCKAQPQQFPLKQLKNNAL